MPDTFDLFPLRFHLIAQNDLEFRAGETANFFRGQIGKLLMRRSPQLYARIFAPASQTGPSGLQDPPRPFVLRANHLDGTAIAKHQQFELGLNVFDTSGGMIQVLEDVIAELAAVTAVYGHELLRVPLLPNKQAIRTRVHFLSPTELKNIERPEFGPLFARIRDRISTLRALYGSGPLTIDFKSMGERALSVKMTRCELTKVTAERENRFKQQRHSLGGFVGVAEYEGELTEFVPYLEAARYTGVGRQTVWGKGEISYETY